MLYNTLHFRKTAMKNNSGACKNTKKSLFCFNICLNRLTKALIYIQFHYLCTTERFANHSD